MRTLLLLCLALAACTSTEETRHRWNTECPISGRPVDAASYFEHEGTRVYFCNPHCAEKSAKEPETWIARVYGERD